MAKKRRAKAPLIALLMAWHCLAPQAWSDAISPSIKETSQTYSNEKPDRAFYGTGIAGRMSEASALRFRGEQETQDGDIDLALRQLGKAVQLDPGDPTGHLLYARALSKRCASVATSPLSSYKRRSPSGSSSGIMTPIKTSRWKPVAKRGG